MSQNGDSGLRMAKSVPFERRAAFTRLRSAPPLLLAAALALAALIAFLPGQSALPPSDRDEARFAQASKQMLERGDFADIRFQDQPRHNKPVGIYWLQAASAALAGGPEAATIAAYRVPSWVGAAAAAGLTAWAVAPLIGAPAGLAAGAFLAASVLLGVEARIAKTDAALLAVVVLAMGALARVMLEPARKGAARLFWAAVGVGVLLKGPIVLIPPAGAILWRLATERSLAALHGLRWGEGALIALAIAAPWLVAITLATDGAFWTRSLGEDLLAKVATGRESHGAPPGLYLAIFWGTFWPMAALAPLAAVALWRRRATLAGRVLLGWIVPTWLLFELVATKLPHYVLPAYPAIAAAIAWMLVEGAAPETPRWARRALLALFALPALAIPLGAMAAPPVIEGRVAWGAVALGAAALAPLALAARALGDWRLGAFAAFAVPGAALAQAAAFGFALPALETAFPAPRMAAAAAAHRCAPGPVAITEYGEPSAVFALGTDTLVADGAEAAAALTGGRVALAFVGARDKADFLKALEGRATEAEAVTTVTGFNYSKGRRAHLTLWRRAGGCD